MTLLNIKERLESLADDIENKPPTQKQVILDLRMLAKDLESERQAFLTGLRELSEVLDPNPRKGK